MKNGQLYLGIDILRPVTRHSLFLPHGAKRIL